VLLAHAGGPYWRNRDLGAWGLPKGEVGPGEDLLAAARREFAEETGHAPGEPALPLTSRLQPGGKHVHAWAIEGDFDPGTLVSNSFAMEWPPKSGKWQEFPEIDRAEWFPLDEARRRITRGQLAFLDELHALLGAQ
jgi:predicted NUDIX family NTP pyrophosphohydrolase